RSAGAGRRHRRDAGREVSLRARVPAGRAPARRLDDELVAAIPNQEFSHMLSVVVDKPNSMAVIERPMPQPGPGEVRVRVRDGGFSQYVCAPEKNAYVIPAGMAQASASIIEPFAVAANVTHRTGVLPSDIALIYGAGPVGLNLLQVLKRVYGVRTFITDRVD